MAAYIGPGSGKVSYPGILRTAHGLISGEIPAIPGVVASGMTASEVKSTLQGLLEEHIEMMLDAQLVLPEADDSNVEIMSMEEPHSQPEIFHVIVPSTAKRDLLVSFHDYASFLPATRLLEFTAVVLQNGQILRAHFPDLPGAFTSGSSEAEIEGKLQSLLETYIGLTLKAGDSVPVSKFGAASDLEMTEDELALTPIVSMPAFTVEIPT